MYKLSMLRKFYCAVCNNEYEMPLDADLFKDMIGLPDVLRPDGRLNVACESCHPYDGKFSAMKEYQEKYGVHHS